MKDNLKKVMKIIGNVLVAILIIVTAFITIISLATSGPDRIPNVMGYIPFSIQTESMEPEIMTGDLIVTEVYEDQDLKIDDVISFFAIEQNKKIIKTHRIIGYNEIDDTYVTKGDNNSIEDEIPVPPGDIIAVWSGTRIPLVGKIKDVFGSKYGFLILIILPLFIFFLYQLYSFIVLIIDVRKEQLIKEVKEVSQATATKPAVTEDKKVESSDDEVEKLKAQLAALQAKSEVKEEQPKEDVEIIKEDE